MEKKKQSSVFTSKLKTLKSYTLAEYLDEANASSISFKKNGFDKVMFFINGKKVGTVAQNVLDEKILSWDDKGNIHQNGGLCINKVQGEPTEYNKEGVFYLLSKDLNEDLGTLEVEF